LTLVTPLSSIDVRGTASATFFFFSRLFVLLLETFATHKKFLWDKKERSLDENGQKQTHSQYDIGWYSLWQSDGPLKNNKFEVFFNNGRSHA
jgi:hypothetical protein